MPIYTAINKQSKKTKELGFMSISEMEEWRKSHLHWEILCGAPLIHSGAGLGLKSMRGDEVFKDKLRQIDKKNPGNNLRDYAKF